jgi:hypothetical protein
MFSYHSSDEGIVSGIRPILEKDRIPIWIQEPADKKYDMYERYAPQKHSLVVQKPKRCFFIIV